MAVGTQKHLGLFSKDMCVMNHLTCLVFVFARFGAPGVQMAPVCLVTRQLQEKNTKKTVLGPCKIEILWQPRSELPVKKANNRRTQPRVGRDPN